jgi:AAA domain-containing protein
METIDDYKARVCQLERENETLERVISTFGEFEDQAQALAEDRQRMLEVLGLTEHEWACRGGQIFSSFKKPSELRPESESLSRIEAPTVLPEPPIPPPPPPPQQIEWTEEQKIALDEIDEWMAGGAPFHALTGPAGTGKSTLVREIISRHPDACLTAMTGKAALRLSQCAWQGASTLHKVLYYPPKPGEELKFCRLREPSAELVFVDEASMMGPSVFVHLDAWVRTGVRFLLVGDSFQLPPVITDKQEIETFGEDYSVFTTVGGSVLRTVMRNAGGVLRAASKVRETGEIYMQSDIDASGNGYEFCRESWPIDRAVSDYLAVSDDHLLITWRNGVRMAANMKIRTALGREGPLPDEGEPVLIRKNGQGFLNGEIAICGGFEAGPTIGEVRCLWMMLDGRRVLVSYEGRDCAFDGQFPKIQNWRGYHIDLKKSMLPEPLPVTWGYCLTAHAAQGSEARRVTVFLDRGDERSTYFRKSTRLPNGEETTFAARWIYTAITRSKSRTTMVLGR